MLVVLNTIRGNVGYSDLTVDHTFVHTYPKSDLVVDKDME